MLSPWILVRVEETNPCIGRGGMQGHRPLPARIQPERQAQRREEL
jgi:hypothetical protein